MYASVANQIDEIEKGTIVGPMRETTGEYKIPPHENHPFYTTTTSADDQDSGK